MTIAILIIVQNNNASLELLVDATVAPIPSPKINRAPNNGMNILGVIITCPILKGLNFIY
ncbi:MAG: hypothetical protein AAF688_10560 [Bacteroidota bacterium]